MESDWSKVLEVFGSGIIGVFLVMIIVQVLTQLSTRIIDAVENWNAVEDIKLESKNQSAPVKG
jgi:hypothetical protein